MASASSPGGQKPAAASTPPNSGPTAPKRLGKYELRKKIGAGGMGAVYLAYDTQLKRPVALKMLPREKAQNPTLVKRFKSEAHSAARLKHDNIVTIYEAGEADGSLYIALEYVEGTDVFKLLSSRGVLPVKRSIDIIKQVARALKHAHARNIVHRDIKPSNLLIQRDGTVKLTDMGLARSLDEETETGITRAGMTVGTVDYMSPEQARDSKLADVRSDIYSLGCTWYHMLTGAPPFAAGSVTNKLYNHAAKSRPDPRDTNEAIPEGVVRTMHRMMARKPADRYQTPAELLADLENVNALTVSSADKLLATLSDTGDSKPKSKPPAAPTFAVAGTPASGTKKVTLPDAPEGGDEWVKYAVGLSLLGGLVILVLWISQQLSSVLDSGGVIVNRGGNERSREEGDGGGTPRGVPSTDGSADGRSSNDGTNGGNNSDDGGRSTNDHPTRGPDRRPQIERVVVQFHRTTDPAVLETIGIGRRGEKEYMPPWIAEFPAPDKPAAGGVAAGMQTLSVGRVGETVSKFSSINAALEQLPAVGGVVQLVGPGPFDLNPIQIAGGRKIIITGTPSNRPVVVLQPDTDDPSRPVVTVADGSLTLLNLELAAAAERFGQEGSATLIDVRASELAVRQCSFTLLGNRRGPTAFVRSSPSADSRSANSESGPGQVRLLLDRLFVRGNALTAVAVGGTGCDLVASNCLFLAGTAPIVRVSGSISAAAAENGKRREAGEREAIERVLRFISCTGVASKTALEFVPGSEGAALPPTGVLTLNSLFTVPGGNGDLTLASLGHWPQQQSRGAGESSFVNLSWTVRSSVCMGWTAFVRHDGDPPLVLTSIPQWQNAWNRLVDASRFEKNLAWPTEPPTNLSEAEPIRFDPTTTGVDDIVATDGGPPGCQVADLATPQPEIMRRVAAQAEWPIAPPAIFQNGDPVRIVHVDLGKEDLGRVVSRGDWRSGTLFVASGSGMRKSSPIRVRGISVRIEFRQTAGRPLQISPRAVNTKTVQQEGSLADAFVSVDEGGRIEIAHASFRIPNSTSVPYPKWILAAREGSFLFEQCIVLGPVAGNARTEGLIRWERAADAAVQPLDAGRYEQYGEIRNSYFKGAGKLLQLDIAGRALIVSNSLLVSSGDLFDLNIRGSGPLIHGVAQIQHCTLSAQRTFFKLSAFPRHLSAKRPLQFLVNDTVFAPPPPAAAAQNGPTLFAYNDAAARSEQQVQWWGQANGYTHRLRKHLVGPAETNGRAEQFDAGWRNAWQTAACLRPLSGSGAVALNKPLPTAARLQPGDFALYPSSKATGWTADGKPIGADVNALTRIGPESALATKQPSGNKRRKPRKPTF